MRSSFKAIVVLTILVLLAVSAQASPARAVDIDLKWDPVEGATGYRVYQSADLGVTWTLQGDNITATTFKVIGVPELSLVLFRVGAFNASTQAIRTWSGAWYDYRLRPINTPGGNSIP